MKRRSILRLAAIGGTSAILPSTSPAQLFGLGTKRISLTATITTPDGQPIEGATVMLALPRDGYGRDISFDGQTDKHGRISLSGRAEGMIFVYALKAGYYNTRSRRYYADSPVLGELEESGKMTVTLRLFPIRNPAPFRRRFFANTKLPAFGVPFSYDVEACDWTAPHGRGVSADFTFLVQGYFNSNQDFEKEVVLTFRYPGDGIMPTTILSNQGSDLKFPYLAPETGYSPSFRWLTKYAPNADDIEIPKIDHNRAYIFRVRSETDAAGNVVRALYGVINGEISVGGDAKIGRWIGFESVANPDRTRNIEFDFNKIYRIQPLPWDPAVGRPKAR